MKIFSDRTLRKLLYALPLISLLLSSCSSAQAPSDLSSPEEVEIYLKNQISEGSQDVALAVYSVNEDGTLRMDDALAYNEDTPMPLASTVKIVVLAAYAQAVAEGSLNPDEEVSVRDWEAYYLPFTDGNAHSLALESLGIASDEFGFAEEDVSVRLDDIASAMIVQSDNAATDYLMNRLGDGALVRVIEENNLAQQEVPLSILGTLLALNEAEREGRTYAPDEFRLATERYEERYVSDSAWREAQIEAPLASLGSFDKQARAFQAFTSGSAEDYARIMAGVVSETFIGAEASGVMRRHLEWPMQIPGNEEVFQTFGAKGGSLPGIVTEASYLVPKEGDFAGEPRVAVLFLNRLSEAASGGLAESFAQQTVLLQLAVDRAAVERFADIMRLSE